MATFGSFISLRALALLLPLWRLALAGWRATWGVPNPVLEGGPRVQPSKNVRLYVVPQAFEGLVVGAVLPELGNGRGRVFGGHAPRHQARPDSKRLEVASVLDAGS